MKKTFRLTAPNQDDARVRDKIRHEVNKYVKRERRKTLPEDHDRWSFHCRLGASEATAVELPLKEIPTAIDRVASAGAETVFIEILAQARARQAGPEA